VSGTCCFYGPGALVSLGRRQRATGRQEKCIFHAYAKKKMVKNRSPEPVFELPAHFTEWSGREGGPVGRPLARPWPPFGPTLAALPPGPGGPSGRQVS
jgi:hypothetical protein